EMNRVEDRVEVFEGDVRDNLPDLDIEADRIIMNLPESSEEFVELALGHVREGGTIHYYSFEPKEDLWDAAERQVEEMFAGYGAEVEIEDSVVCGHYNPAVERVCFDVRVNRPPRHLK
ncbi:MAG: class I SAM-dependent methyltransferase family protein, partial [Candidatus Nanohaloarchaea archaeon]